jgi:hypothetical protein
MQLSRVDGSASRHQFRVRYNINASESREHDFASSRCGLELFWCWRTRVWYFIDYLLFSGSELCTQPSYPVQCCTRTSRLHVRIATTNVVKCASASVSVPQRKFGEPIATTPLGILDQQLSPALTHSIVCHCLPRNAMTVLDHFIKAISVSLVRCYPWFPATLLFIQPGMSKGYIADTCSATSNNTDVYTIVPHKQLSFADKCQPSERYPQSKTRSLHAVYSALASCPYTAPFSRLQFRNL